VLASLSFASFTTFAPPASAQGDGEIDALDSAARAIFEDGRRAFEAGDFETALSRFQNAYDISHRPLLLWNIATTLDRLRRDEEALTTFQQYLDAVPDAANRTEVMGRIRSLRESVDARAAEREAAEAERLAREAEAARLAEERAALERERAAGGGGGGVARVRRRAVVVGSRRSSSSSAPASPRSRAAS
jgi:tetratricopeptide (TPR) repeat protein